MSTSGSLSDERCDNVEAAKSLKMDPCSHSLVLVLSTFLDLLIKEAKPSALAERPCKYQEQSLR